MAFEDISMPTTSAPCLAMLSDKIPPPQPTSSTLLPSKGTCLVMNDNLKGLISCRVQNGRLLRLERFVWTWVLCLFLIFFLLKLFNQVLLSFCKFPKNIGNCSGLRRCQRLFKTVKQFCDFGNTRIT